MKYLQRTSRHLRLLLATMELCLLMVSLGFSSPVDGFSLQASAPHFDAHLSSIGMARSLSILNAAAESNAEDTPSFPPLSQEEAQELLDNVPVYAVTEPDKGGLVLVREKGKDQEIAYFFFNPETANQVFAPLRQKNPEASWDVTRYPLGLVWYELLHAKDDGSSAGVEYRLVPEGNDLMGARTILEQQAKQMGSEPPAIFQASSNEIPVFVDQFLRLQGSDGVETFPMYLSYNDLIMTLKQSAASTLGDEFEAAITVVDLASLLQQMAGEFGDAQNDWRNTMLVPASFSQPSTMATKLKEPLDEEDEKISTPTAMDNWED